MSDYKMHTERRRVKSWTEKGRSRAIPEGRDQTRLRRIKEKELVGVPREKKGLVVEKCGIHKPWGTRGEPRGQFN